jgi:hypothetical protein
MIREIVDVGFAAGLLRKGDPQWHLGGTAVESREAVAENCWDRVSVECDIANILD